VPPLLRPTSPRCHTVSRFLCFIFWQCSSRHLSSWAKIKTLNSHHRRQSPFTDTLTPTIHCYKKVISTFVTLTTTQSHLYFASSLARAPGHQISTHRHRSFSPSSHTHRPSTQWHPQQWTSQPSFISETAYQHVNSRKKDILKSRIIAWSTSIHKRNVGISTLGYIGSFMTLYLSYLLNHK
jgi:hypothetical protein